MTPRCLRSGAPRGRTAFLQPPVVHLRQRLQRRAHSALAASASAQPSTVSEASTSTPCWQKLEAGCWLGSVEERRGARGAELIGDAILAKKFKAHDAALTAAMIVKDERGRKTFLTASLDKTLASFTFQGELAECQTMEIHRLAPAGAPVFSLCQPDDKLASFDAAAAITTSSSSSAAAADRVRPIFCGTAAKEVVTLSGVGLPPAPGAPTTGPTVSDKVQLRDHTGWVRSLAASGKWLFSCGCNYVKVWDTTWPLPREAHTAKLFTGDILCLVAGVTLGPNGLSPVPRVYACCTNGCLAAWDVDKQGKLKPVGSRDKAHAGRATCLLAAGNFLYSVGSDGALRAWSADKLELVMEVAAAHDGQRINALALGPDGLLYTGGDDKLVRRWSPGLLEPVAEPLYAHTAAVKVLAAGLGEVVLSGDASGEACLWYV